MRSSKFGIGSSTSSNGGSRVAHGVAGGRAAARRVRAGGPQRHRQRSSARPRAALAASEPSVARPRRLPRAQTKPAFGEKSADEIAALFRAFQRDHARNYTEAAEAAYRFDVFKRNLRFIDSLNAQNPLAVFAVNRFADLTEDERARLRMTNNATTSWAGLKALLARSDPGMAAAAERGRGAVEAPRRRGARSRRAATGSSATTAAARSRWKGGRTGSTSRRARRRRTSSRRARCRG